MIQRLALGLVVWGSALFAWGLNTPTPTSTATDTPCAGCSFTSTPTDTATPTFSNTPANSFTPTATSTNTVSNTPTNTPTATASNTATSTSTVTGTPTLTPSPTSTGTPTPTPTPTATFLFSPTPTPPFTAGDCSTIETYAYPDPVPGNSMKFLFVRCEAGAVKIRVYNPAVGLAASYATTGAPGPNVYPVDASVFSHGVYYYFVESSGPSGGRRSKPTKFAVTRSP